MDADTPRELLEETVEAWSKQRGDALARAEAEGLLDPAEVETWADRARGLVLHPRAASELRAELDGLCARLHRLLRRLPAGSVEPAAAVQGFLGQLPRVRELVAEDVEAAFDGDPAARSFAEIVLAYPGLEAVVLYRLAHELHQLGVPVLPRMMTEFGHRRTGIDIHPGARIGRRFFIDHGTGVVIGESAEIGDRVKLYQGVTLGALSTRRGQSLRGVKRHPTIGDDVTIYAGATILGGETHIGSGCVIGGSVWLTESVPERTLVFLRTPPSQVRRSAAESETAEAELVWEI